MQFFNYVERGPPKGESICWPIGHAPDIYLLEGWKYLKPSEMLLDAIYTWRDWILPNSKITEVATGAMLTDQNLWDGKVVILFGGLPDGVAGENGKQIIPNTHKIKRSMVRLKSDYINMNTAIIVVGKEIVQAAIKPGNPGEEYQNDTITAYKWNGLTNLSTLDKIAIAISDHLRVRTSDSNIPDHTESPYYGANSTKLLYPSQQNVTQEFYVK